MCCSEFFALCVDSIKRHLCVAVCVAVCGAVYVAVCFAVCDVDTALVCGSHFMYIVFFDGFL